MEAIPEAKEENLYLSKQTRPGKSS